MTNQLSKEIGKTLTPPKDFFKWCESQIPIFEWSNKEKTIKSSERTDCELIKKRLTKNSRLTFSVKFYQFSIILVSKNRIEIQSHDYWQEIKEGKEILSKRLTNFERFENGKHIKAYNTYNNQWDNGLRTSYGFMSGNYTNTIFYPNNWQSKLKNNRDLKYLTLPRIQRQDISRIYKYRYEIEYLQKIGNKRLAENIMFTGKLPYGTDYYSTVDMTTINKNWLKKNKSLLKNSDKSFNEIMLELCFKKQNIKMIDNIARLVHYKQLKKLPKEISLNKFINYFKKNNFSIDYYLDYIYMLQELGTPLKSDLVIFPKDIKKAHDDLVSVIGKLERELEEKAYLKQLPKIRKYEQEIDEFMFLVPKDLQEIVNEGNALHHCVGGKHYLDNHTKGNTNIIFIRQKDEVEKPYFTLEYKNQHVAQVQGKYNRETVPNDLQKAINKWEDKIKRIS